MVIDKFLDRHKNKINFLFSYVSISVLFFSFIESITYSGFIRNHFFIPLSSIFLIYLFIIMLIYFKKVFNFNRNKLFLQLNQLFFIPIVLTYYLLIFSEETNYPNYVYSNYHIDIEGFSKFVLFSSIILFFSIFIKNDIIKKFIKKFNLYKIIFFSFFLFFAIKQSNLILSEILRSSALTFKAIQVPFKERAAVYSGKGIGQWTFDYTQFVVDNTEANSVIFIPPQKDVWKSTGNLHYMRGFFYPRVLVQDRADEFAEVPEGVDYILISYGMWGGDNHGWPKMTIDKEKIEVIILINRETKEIEKNYEEYVPSFEAEEWGLIKLKHD